MIDTSYSSGSGNSPDFALLLPQTLFGSDLTKYVYVYAAMGGLQTGAGFTAASGHTGGDGNGGFEEWSSYQGPIVGTPDDTIVKSAVVNTADHLVHAAGDVITYTVTVTNSGGLPLTTVVVTDQLEHDASAVTLTSHTDTGSGNHGDATLDVGEIWTYTFNHTVTSAEYNSEQTFNGGNLQLTNSASVTTTQVATKHDEATVSVSAAPPPISGVTINKVTIDQNHTPGSDTATILVGEAIHWQYTVTNPNVPGAVTLTSVIVTDDNGTPGNSADDFTVGTIASLAVGSSVTFTHDSVATAGAYQNNAAVTAGSTAGPASGSDLSGYFGANASLTVNKITTDNTHPASGDGITVSTGNSITWQYTVTNNGNVALNNVVVKDDAGTPGNTGDDFIVGTIATLAAGAAATLTHAGTAQAGSYANVGTASTTFTDTAGDTKAVSNTNSSSYFGASPGLSIVKTVTSVSDVNGDTLTDKGDIITYKLHVTNTGNVALTGVTVTDPFTGNPVGALASLTVGQSQDLTVSHTITQAEVDANQPITNTGFADSNETPTTSSSTTTAIDYKPGLSIVKTVTSVSDVNGDTLTDKGDIITYKLHVTNTGDVTLTGVTVTDPFTGNPVGALASLTVGQSQDLTVSHTITQAEVDANQPITNTGFADSNETPTTSSSTTTAIDYKPGLSIVKTVTSVSDVNGDTLTDKGDIITYKLHVTNTGDVTLTGVTVTDPFTGNPAGVLASLTVGQSQDLTVSHTITQAEVDANQPITNTGFADSNETPTTSSSTTTAIDYKPGLSIVKTVTSVSDVNGDTLTDKGDIITYKLHVTNTGDVTLTGVTVTDPFTGNPAGALASLTVGQSQDLTVSHTITQAEVDADQPITNTGFADSNETPTTSSSTTTAIDYKPGLSIVKTVTSVSDVNGDTLTDKGDIITYKLHVTNTGDVTLTGVTVTDPFTGNPAGVLASLTAGQSQDLTVSHTITQAEVDANQPITNTGFADSNETPTTSSSTTTAIDYKPGLSIVKTVTSVTDVNGDKLTDKGDIITYNLHVTNTGDVTLTGVTVTDPVTGNPAGVLASLTVGQSQDLTVSHTITQAEVDANQPITNTGFADSNETPTTSSSTTTTIDYKPGLSIVKTVTSVSDVNGDTLTDKGDIITYKLHVTNTGDVTLTGVTVTDPFTGNPVGVLASLTVGQSQDLTVSHTITQAEVDANQPITNTGFADSNETPTTSSTVTTAIDYKPHVVVTKEALGVSHAQLGTDFTYQITVTNDGDVTLTNVQVSDRLEGQPNPVNLGNPATDIPGDGIDITSSGNSDATLDVGETWTYTYHHIVDLGDLNVTSSIGWSDRGKTDHTTVPVVSANGALLFAGSDVGATGTGLIQSFLRLQANGSEQGFNTDYRPAPLDDKAGDFTHSITLGDIPTVEIDGVTYREFRLDLNEKDSKLNDNISLTSLKLFSADAGNLSTLSSAQLLYNLDSAGDVSLPLTEWSTGSGHGDYVVVVPDAAFVDAQGHALADCSFIYLYSAFSGSDGGFEEWYIRPAETLDNTVSVTTTQGATGSATSHVTINSTADLDLQISKIAAISGGNGNKIVDAANDHITWTITVHNTSNIDLHNVTVNDPFATATYVSGDNGDHILQANETWTYTATHIVTQAEIDAGVQLVNTATVDADEILPQSATSVVGVVNPFHTTGPGAVFQDPFTASYWAGHLAAWDGSSGNNAPVKTEVKNGHLSSADLFSFTGGVVDSNHNGVIDGTTRVGC